MSQIMSENVDMVTSPPYAIPFGWWIPNLI